MDLQNSLYDEELYERCEDVSDLNKSLFDDELYQQCLEIENQSQNVLEIDIEMLNHTSNGYSAALQPLWSGYTRNPLLIKWENEDEDIEMYDMEACSLTVDAYEPINYENETWCSSALKSDEWFMEGGK